MADIDRSTTSALTRQTVVGLALAAGIVLAWLSVHVWAVFFYPWDRLGLWPVVPIVLVQCWLCVGLFIVAHDCMHGTLAPGMPRLNHIVGTVCLLLYACFWFGALLPKHHLHHRHSGTADDPDFAATPSFWRWYLSFFAEYASWTQIAGMSAILWTYVLVLQAPIANVLLFWAVPPLLASLQLFTFGTYLPHVPGEGPFVDRHNARSNDYPAWLSLLTCFHFGYHHEHHLKPGVPWWRLPSVRGEERLRAGR